MTRMIRSFSDDEAEALFRDGTSKAYRAFAKVAKRKLDMLDAAASLMDLRVPPGNRLEALKGDHEGQFSIRINQQWRICFAWDDNGAENVKIEDYH